ncbi:DUF423 domain-containing protein [Mucilaginibacter sp. KACC 22063]|uniref:DUF423 domain-containing protein n=1 Tax=Mucilaginibacter sp. KACC 22063 TaxID=3025666 RepID=UPI002366B64C|nr:DUF423 domain-containing protein [Mucilaginibacter sp. KACC 22063]WDF54152.1 DUF423 domain-containing protein [Mucilaginibacter sp. KACC 22063]
MNKQIVVTGALFGMVAVITGAFGAHALKSLLAPAQLEIWHTAVQYQFYHTFALLFLSTFSRFKNNYIFTAYWLFVFGIILFSGSLYLLSLRSALGWNGLMWLGPVTPVGGLLFISGWITLAIAGLRNK